MKFLRIRLNSNGRGFTNLENNFIHLLNLYTFLDEECSSSLRLDSYFDFLKSEPEMSIYGGRGDSVYLKEVGQIIEIRDNFENDEDALLVPIVFSTTRKKLIDLIEKWHAMVKDRGNLPQNIIIIQNQTGDVTLEATTDIDPRFSHLLSDNEPAYAFIEKSNLFDNYWHVEANQGSLFKFARVLGDYLSNKKKFEEWLTNEDQQCLLYSNLLSLCRREKNNNDIEIDLKIWHDKDINIVEYPLAKNHFIDLLNETERLINLCQKNDRIVLTPEYNKIKLTIQKINTI